MLYVTQPFLPPLEEYTEYLKQIWDNKWLTNNGPFHIDFEKKLCEYLGVTHLSLFANGTLALTTALQALRITGEVITTPYSFVATTHALHWNGIQPVFVDIDPETCNINAEKIEAAITPKTTAILAVHVYGNPCNMKEIQKIADTYGLKVIYDAAHAFGINYQGRSLAEYGDLSILSFHATKVFTTFEGGAIISHDPGVKKRIDYLKNFGFADEVTVVGPGINAKMNEVQAAMGILQLKYIERIIKKRSELSQSYKNELSDVKGIRFLKLEDDLEYNHSYFPIFIDKLQFGISRDEVYDKFKAHDIYARRYFYPLITDYPTYRSLPSASAANLPGARKISEQVLCLPLHTNMGEEDIRKVCSILKK